jgi:hypothetical protein
MARTNTVKRYQGRKPCQHETTTTESCRVCGGDGYLDEPVDRRGDTGPPTPECSYCQGTGKSKVTRPCGLTKAEHHSETTRTDHVHDGGTLTCEKCSRTISIGQPYKWVKPGAKGRSRKRNRCMDCPGWKASELTSSAFLGIIYTAEEDAPGVDVADTDAEDLARQLTDLRDHYEEAAREAAEVRTEAADNMDDGFGHETGMSTDLREQGETAEAEELAGVERDQPGPEVGDEPEDPDPDDYEEEADYEAATVTHELELQDWEAARDEAAAELEGWAEGIMGEIVAAWEQVQG